MPKNFDFGASVKLKRPNNEEPKQQKNELNIIEKTANTATNTKGDKLDEAATTSTKPSPEKPKQPSKEETRLNGFRLPVGLDHLLESYAYHEGVNKTDIVIESLKQYFKNRKVDLIPIKKRKKK